MARAVENKFYIPDGLDTITVSAYKSGLHIVRKNSVLLEDRDPSKLLINGEDPVADFVCWVADHEKQMFDLLDEQPNRYDLFQNNTEHTRTSILGIGAAALEESTDDIELVDDAYAHPTVRRSLKWFFYDWSNSEARGDIQDFAKESARLAEKYELEIPEDVISLRVFTHTKGALKITVPELAAAQIRANSRGIDAAAVHLLSSWLCQGNEVLVRKSIWG